MSGWSLQDTAVEWGGEIDRFYLMYKWVYTRSCVCRVMIEGIMKWQSCPLQVNAIVARCGSATPPSWCRTAFPMASDHPRRCDPGVRHTLHRLLRFECVELHETKETSSGLETNLTNLQTRTFFVAWLKVKLGIVDRVEESRPPTTSIILGGRGEEFLSAHYTRVSATFKKFIILARECSTENKKVKCVSRVVVI